METGAGREITHEMDENGRWVQVVTPARLLEILEEDGCGIAPPRDFGEGDQWEVSGGEGGGGGGGGGVGGGDEAE